MNPLRGFCLLTIMRLFAAAGWSCSSSLMADGMCAAKPRTDVRPLIKPKHCAGHNHPGHLPANLNGLEATRQMLHHNPQSKVQTPPKPTKT